VEQPVALGSPATSVGHAWPHGTGAVGSARDLFPTEKAPRGRSLCVAEPAHSWPHPAEMIDLVQRRKGGWGKKQGPNERASAPAQGSGASAGAAPQGGRTFAKI
jgi:hypothetical protein